MCAWAGKEDKRVPAVQEANKGGPAPPARGRTAERWRGRSVVAENSRMSRRRRPSPARTSPAQRSRAGPGPDAPGAPRFWTFHFPRSPIRGPGLKLQQPLAGARGSACGRLGEMAAPGDVPGRARQGQARPGQARRHSYSGRRVVGFAAEDVAEDVAEEDAPTWRASLRPSCAERHSPRLRLSVWLCPWLLSAAHRGGEEESASRGLRMASPWWWRWQQ